MTNNRDYFRAKRAIEFFTNNADDRPKLSDLAKHLKLSEYHCHRLFKKWAGITPQNFLKAITLIKAKRLLEDQDSILQTSLDLGLSSSSRLHDLFIKLEAMTPGEYKRKGEGTKIYWTSFDSPMGKMTLAKTQRGICHLQFSEDKNWKQKWPKAKFVRDQKRLESDCVEICTRMRGAVNKKLNLIVSATEFQVQIWQALLHLPEGQMCSYTDLAKMVNKPKAFRAVGSAVGANPIAYLIPCHRVIKSTGIIGDYHWGSDRKTLLIAVEKSRCSQSHRLTKNEFQTNTLP